MGRSAPSMPPPPHPQPAQPCLCRCFHLARCTGLLLACSGVERPPWQLAPSMQYSSQLGCKVLLDCIRVGV